MSGLVSVVFVYKSLKMAALPSNYTVVEQWAVICFLWLEYIKTSTASNSQWVQMFAVQGDYFDPFHILQQLPLRQADIWTCSPPHIPELVPSDYHIFKTTKSSPVWIDLPVIMKLKMWCKSVFDHNWKLSTQRGSEGLWTTTWYALKKGWLCR